MAFFQDSQPARQPFLNAPAAVLWLIGALLAAHAVREMLPGDLSREVLDQFAFIPARYSGGIAAPGLLEQTVTFVSYTFVHSGLAHAGLNSLWLLAFGPSVARRLRTARFFAFYVVCAIAAAAAHLISDWGSFIPVVGASGAISGLMAAAIRILYGSRLLMFTGRAPLAPILSRPVLLFTAIWTAVNIVVGTLGLGFTREYELIAWVAHLGGYFAGLLLIGLFDKRRPAAPSA